MRENSPYIAPAEQPAATEALVLPVANRENEFETSLDAEGGQEERETVPSSDQQELSDTLTPLGDIASPRRPFGMRRASTTSSLQSTTSSKREKTPPLIRSEPQHILRVSVKGMAALPNIQSKDISLRASVGSVQLAELPATTSREDERERERDERVWDGEPVIRARIELGKQVERYGLPSTAGGRPQDVAALLSVSGLEAALLVKNVAVLKDFFDDEYEADAPVPVQILVRDTKLQLRESLEDTADTESTMNVCVKSVEVHRGKRIVDTNLFSSSSYSSSRQQRERGRNMEGGAESVDAMQNSAAADDGEEETLRLSAGQVAALREVSPAAVSTDGSTASNSNADLLETFRSFVRVFESHVRRHGGLKVQLSQPDHIAGLLQNLQISLGEEEHAKTDAPPTYSEMLEQSTRAATTLSQVSGESPETARRRLARVRAENEDLVSQLMQTKMLLAERSQDLDEVTSECKKAKDDLVTHKQVLENYQEHIERLLTENADLKSIATALQ